MTLQQIIEAKVTQSLTPSHLEVINESHMHNVPPGSESHFKLVVVSENFKDKTRIQRHQAVNGILAEELNGGIHALSMVVHTDEEWAQREGRTLESPLCHGGGKSKVE